MCISGFFLINKICKCFIFQMQKAKMNHYFLRSQTMRFALTVKSFASMDKGMYNGYEQPQWELYGDQPKDESYQVRRYPAANWTSTEQSSEGYDGTTTSPFRRLFKYITGANSRDTSINMTVPVLSQISGQPCPFTNSTYKMLFYVPQKFQSAPPEPSDPLVKTERLDEVIAYVRAFSGRPKAKDWQKEASRLHESLLKNGVNDTSIKKNMFYTVTYDSPFRLFFRRNEVWLMPQKEKMEQNQN